MSTYTVEDTGRFIAEFRIEFETAADRDEWHDEVVTMMDNGCPGYYKVTKGLHITYGDTVIDDSKALYLVCDNDVFIRFKKMMNEMCDYKEVK